MPLLLKNETERKTKIVNFRPANNNAPLKDEA
jgi:hypothetical protein